MLNIGILGCGKMGRVHAEVFAKNKNCRITGLYNRTIEKAAEIQKNHPEAKIYSSWQDMINDPDIDVITISTPQADRLEKYKLAIEQGKHVFLEKPMGYGLRDVKETLELLEDSNCCFYADSQIRSQPTILAINKELSRIGQIFHIDLEFSMYREEIKWKHKLISGGGILRELCGHLIDQAADWLGEPECITANNKIVLPGREVEDYTINMVEYKNGATLLLQGSYFDRKGMLYKGRILGRKGQINFTFSSYSPSDAWAEIYIGDKREDITISIPEDGDINSVYPGHMDSFKKEIDRFVECVLNGEKAVDTLTKEWNTTQLIAASYESSRTGNKIFLPLEDFDSDNLKDCYQYF